MRACCSRYSIFSCSSAAATAVARSFRELVRRELIFRARVPERRDEFARVERSLRAEEQRLRRQLCERRVSSSGPSHHRRP